MVKLVMACNYTIYFERHSILNNYIWYSIFHKPTLSHYTFVLDTSKRWKQERTNKRLRKYG